MEVNISFLDGIDTKLKSKVNIDEFQRLLTKAESNNMLNIKPEIRSGFISLVFVDDSKIQELNKKWRNKNKPTDVLSFSNLGDDNFPYGDGHVNIGEVFISLNTAFVQSLKYKHSLQEELNKLFVHGVLHIFGFLHDLEEDFLVMNSLEDKILKG